MYYNVVKEKIHMAITLGTGKATNKIQYSFMTKSLSKLGIKGSFYMLIKIN
jgi:hypothetical protein